MKGFVIFLALLAVAIVAAGYGLAMLTDRPQEPPWPQVCQEMMVAGDPAATPMLVCLPATVTPPPTWGAETRAAVATWESERAQVAP